MALLVPSHLRVHKRVHGASRMSSASCIRCSESSDSEMSTLWAVELSDSTDDIEERRLIGESTEHCQGLFLDASRVCNTREEPAMGCSHS